MDAGDIIGDREAAQILGISEATLRRHCMKSFVCRPGTVDVRHAFPVVVGRKRRWLRSRVMDLISCPVAGR